MQRQPIDDNVLSADKFRHQYAIPEINILAVKAPFPVSCRGSVETMVSGHSCNPAVSCLRPLADIDRRFEEVGFVSIDGVIGRQLVDI